MTEPIIKIEAGQKIPEASVHIKSEGGIDAISTTDYFKGRRVVMFAVPGAFTSTCSAKHVPSFLANAAKFSEAGFDKIACLSVNDAHVMREWGLSQKTEGVIDMLADPRAEFSDALGLTRDMGPILGCRAARCALIIDDGVVQKVFMEEPAMYEVSSAENVLANL
ncbi:MAG: peroxiredoxin [Candidatus Puniceispirillum sp.]|jgi:peroxiredoxin